MNFLMEKIDNAISKAHSVKRSVLLVLVLCFSFTYSQKIVLQGDIKLVKSEVKEKKNNRVSDQIVLRGGVKMVDNEISKTPQKKQEIKPVLAKKKIIKKKQLVTPPIKVKSQRVYHFNSQENQTSFAIQGISLKNAVQNTRENTAKMLLFSSAIQLENRLLQTKKIERRSSFVRYQFSKTYTTRPPPFGRV